MKSNLLGLFLVYVLFCVSQVGAIRIDTLSWVNNVQIGSSCPTKLYDATSVPGSWLASKHPSCCAENPCFATEKKDLLVSLVYDTSLMNRLPKRILWKDIRRVIVEFEMNNFTCYPAGWIDGNQVGVTIEAPELIQNDKNRYVYNYDSLQNGTSWKYITCVVETMMVNSSSEDSVYVLNNGPDKNIAMRVIPPGKEIVEKYDCTRFNCGNPTCEHRYYVPVNSWRIKKVQIVTVVRLPKAPTIESITFGVPGDKGDTMPRSIMLSGARDIEDPTTVHKNFKLSYTITHTPNEGGQKQADILGEIDFTLLSPDDQATFDTTLQLPFAPGKAWPDGKYVLSGYLIDADDARVDTLKESPLFINYTLNKAVPSIQSATLVSNTGKTLAFNLDWTPHYNSGELGYNPGDGTFEAVMSQYRYKIRL